MKKPLVSIIIPTYNSGKSLEVCLDSIKKQSYPNIEIIVVDEFSSDNTKKIAKKYATFFSLKGERSIARNFGASKAKGEYFLFIDSDMELTNHVVSSCVKLIQARSAIVIPEVSAGHGFWTECRILERSCYQKDNFIEAARFFPKKTFGELGGYDESMAGSEDWDIHQRALVVGINILRVEDYIVHHEGEISLLRSMKKKMYYGRVFRKFQKRHPKAFREAFMRKAFLRNWRTLIADPVHALGVFILKTMEGIALITGMVISRNKSD